MDRRLRRRRRSLGRVVYSDSSIDASIVVVETSGSSSSDDASNVVANYPGLSSRRSSLRRHPRISDPSDTLSIPCPPLTPPPL